jgi:hypothetical protein
MEERMLLKTPTRFLYLILLGLVVTSPAMSAVLDDLDSARSYRAARVSSYDRTGGNADGSQANPLKPGETRVMADMLGPGRIAHIWVTTDGGLEDLILRMYWDGEKTPSVEAPIGEFFGLGHGRHYTFVSLPIAIGNDVGLNCYFPMPFNKRARITIENVGRDAVMAFYYYIDYQKLKAPVAKKLYFHAQYRQEHPVLSSGNYTILRAVGRGHYVGCFFFVQQNEPGWFGEGDDMIYVDGEKQPSLHGTGTEDYFCHAWGFAKQASADRFGVAFSEHPSDGGRKYSVYRFHLEDAITFTKSINVTIEHGHANDHSDDFSSVAYWYQTEPHSPFLPLASPFDRLSSAERGQVMLQEKRFEEYRRWQSEIKQRTTSPYVKGLASFNIAKCIAVEQGPEKGIQALIDCIGPFPTQIWSEKVAAEIKQLGGDPGLVPQSNVYGVTSEGDGRIITAVVDGKLCARTDKAAASPYIYFDVDRRVLHNGDKPVLVEVEYYDEGKAGDTFSIEYDSAFSNTVMDRYHRTEPFVKPGRKGWNTALLYLDRARFNGRQNGGADFRIYCGGDADEYIKSVRVILNKN